AANTMETKRPSRAISAGLRKMPVPTMVPTTMAADAHGPRPRTSSRRFSLIRLRADSWATSVDHRAAHKSQEAARGSGKTRLTSAPTAKVTQEPTKTYQLYATGVARYTVRTAARPANIPASEPLEFARESRVPSKNRPNKLPKGREAMAKPVSNNECCHRTRPKKINTTPQTRVMRREIFRNFAGSVGRPRNAFRSMTLEAAREFSEPEALDMATARIDARSRPANPVGISRTRKRGKMRSVRSPAASRG